MKHVLVVSERYQKYIGQASHDTIAMFFNNYKNVTVTHQEDGFHREIFAKAQEEGKPITHIIALNNKLNKFRTPLWKRIYDEAAQLDVKPHMFVVGQPFDDVLQEQLKKKEIAFVRPTMGELWKAYGIILGETPVSRKESEPR